MESTLHAGYGCTASPAAAPKRRLEIQLLFLLFRNLFVFFAFFIARLYRFEPSSSLVFFPSLTCNHLIDPQTAGLQLTTNTTDSSLLIFSFFFQKQAANLAACTSGRPCYIKHAPAQFAQR